MFDEPRIYYPLEGLSCVRLRSAIVCYLAGSVHSAETWLLWLALAVFADLGDLGNLGDLGDLGDLSDLADLADLAAAKNDRH